MSDPQLRSTEPPASAETPATETVEEALERARHHARSAAVEGLRAARAALDALSLAFYQCPAHESDTLVGLAGGLDRLVARAEGHEPWLPLSASLLTVLDGEIDRWTQRSHEQTEARAVARALIGLREVLWEVGVRPAP